MENSSTSGDAKSVAPQNLSSYKSDTCILYVLSNDQQVDSSHALVAAQAQAVALGLPLAVLYVLDTAKQNRALELQAILNKLLQTESKLNEFRIPLIMLMGKPVEKLQAAFWHFKPMAVYFDASPLQSSKKLIKALSDQAPVVVVNMPKTELKTLTQHPYKWPGTYMSVTALNAAVTSNKNIC